MKKLLRKLMSRGVSNFAHHAERTPQGHEAMMRAGRQMAFQTRNLNDLDLLSDAEFKIFSQFGEDGIIEWLVHRLPGIPEKFVEFGVGDYRESNTHFLLRNRNWRGLILDGGSAPREFLARSHMTWQYDITAVQVFITRENIDALIADNGFGGELGLLSVDIDGNDYWVWDAIQSAKPWIAVCEFNALWGDALPLSMPYDAQFMLTKSCYSRRYFGTSIRAIEHLAQRRGYTLLGSNLAGNNAFFVRNDILEATCLASRIADRRARPSLFRHVQNPDGTLSNISGRRRSEVLADCVAQNVVTGEKRPLREFGDLYTQHWRTILG